MARPGEFRINLLQPKTRVQLPKMWSLVIMLLALITILFSYYFILQSREMSSQQDENIRLKAEIQSYNNKIMAFKPLQAMEQQITVKSEEVAVLEKAQVSYADVINELDRVKTSEIIIASVEITPPRLVVNGFSPDHSNVSLMVEGIKSSPIFTKVDLLSSDINENTNEVKFILEIEWEAS